MINDVIGVDLGGTKVAVASLKDRTLSESTIEPTDLSSAEALVDQLATMIDAQRTDGLQGVGIGVPSVVDFESGRVVSSVNVPLADVPLRQVLGDRLGVPVFVDNDATVAALAEAHDDNLHLVARDLVMITVGTGIGGGFVLGGRIYRGATGGAGEIGHTLIGADLSGDVPRPRRFPQPGSLEREASGHALDALVTEPQLAGYGYFAAARADFLRRLGRTTEARTAYEEALLLTENTVERDFLEGRIEQLKQ